MHFWYYLQFCILTLKSLQAKIVNVYFSTRNLYILGENQSISFFNTGGGIALYSTIFNNDRVASDSYSAVRMTGFPKNSI